MAALTPNDPVFQPGFEDIDTTVAGVVSLYGYLGPREREREGAISSSPADYLNTDAPPFFLLHGTRDPLVPVEWARAFVGKLRSVSEQAVVYAELPGANHAFDLFRSLRSEKVVAAIEAFLSMTVSGSASRSNRQFVEKGFEHGSNRQ